MGGATGLAGGRQLDVVASDGCRLAVRVDGEQGPVVVLAHGWVLGASTFDGLAAELSGRCRVVRYDQRGHGRSGDAGQEVSVRRLGLDLGDVVDATAGEGPLVLVGHSMGGMALLALVGARPELLPRLSGALLLSTSCGELSDVSLGAPRRLRRLGTRAFTGTITGLYPRTRGRSGGRLVRLADRLTARTCFGTQPDPGQVADTRELIAAAPRTTVRACWAAIQAHDEREAATRLRDVPVTVVVGDRDVLTPTRHGRRLAAAAGARLVTLPGVGHMPHLEAPQDVLRELEALLPTG